MKKILCSMALITVLVLSGFSLLAQYCTNNMYSVGCYSTSLGSFRIDSINFGTLNLPSTPCNTTQGQLGYNELKYDTSYMLSGQTYNLSFKIVSSDTNNYLKAWIDYNNNNIFDSTEVVCQKMNVIAGKYNQSITIPPATFNGSYRMRIKLVSGTTFSGACDTATTGETIDFIINAINYTDIRIDSIIMPKDTSIFNTNIAPVFKIHNYGEAFTGGFYIVYTMNPIVYTGSTGTTPFSGTILHDSSVYISGSNLYASKNFTICAYLSMQGYINFSNDTICKQIVIDTIYNKDVGISAITMPNFSVHKGSKVKPTVVINNYGNGTYSNIPVKLSINNIVVDSGIYTGSIPAYASATYSFTNSFKAPDTNFTLCAYTTFIGDTNFSNNSKYRFIAVDTFIKKDVYVKAINNNYPDPIIGNTFIPKITIYNNGNDTISNIPVVYSVSGVVIDSNICTTTIDMGDSTIYTFSKSITVPYNNFNLCAWTSLNGDLIPSNDKFCINTYVQVGINEQAGKDNLIKISPNPAHDLLNISFNSNKNGKTKISIYNIQGTNLFNKEELITTDKSNAHIDISNLKSGIYFIKIENNSGIFNKKFIKE